MPNSYSLIGSSEPSDPRDGFRRAGMAVLERYGYEELLRGVGGPGTWANVIYEATSHQTVLISNAARWQGQDLSGMLVELKTAGGTNRYAYIDSNNTNTLWVNGNFTIPGDGGSEQEYVTIGNAYQVKGHLLSIESFLDAANPANNPNINVPVDNIAILAHASEDSIGVGLANRSPYWEDRFDFEDLINEYYVDGNPLSAKMLPLTQTASGVPGDSMPEVHFLGCGIGGSIPMLFLLKHVLGKPSRIVAPKYTHCLFPYIKNGNVEGVIELFAYKIVLRSPIEYESRSALLSGFVDLEYKDINNEVITRQTYEYFIPPKINRSEWLKQIYIHFGSNDSLLPSRWKTPYPVEVYSYSTETEYVHINQDALTPIQIREALKEAFKKSIGERENSENYPLSKWNDLEIDGVPYPEEMYFPAYKRLGFDSFDDYFDSYNWQEDEDEKGKYIGITHIYEVTLAKVWGKDEEDHYELLYNYFPVDTTINQTIRFDRTNTKLFAIMT